MFACFLNGTSYVSKRWHHIHYDKLHVLTSSRIVLQSMQESLGSLGGLRTVKGAVLIKFVVVDALESVPKSFSQNSVQYRLTILHIKLGRIHVSLNVWTHIGVIYWGKQCLKCVNQIRRLSCVAKENTFPGLAIAIDVSVEFILVPTDR